MLSRRRVLMALSQEGEEEMKEWKTLYEETLTEDKNVTVTGFHCKEVEAYIISDAYEMERNLYLTPSASGTIYGDPRVYVNTGTKEFIAKLALKVITTYLWEVSSVRAFYHGASNKEAEYKAYAHSYIGAVLNKEEINEISIVLSEGKLQAGTKIYVRGR